MRSDVVLASITGVAVQSVGYPSDRLHQSGPPGLELIHDCSVVHENADHGGQVICLPPAAGIRLGGAYVTSEGHGAVEPWIDDGEVRAGGAATAEGVHLAPLANQQAIVGDPVKSLEDQMSGDSVEHIHASLFDGCTKNGTRLSHSRAACQYIPPMTFSVMNGNLESTRASDP